MAEWKCGNEFAPYHPSASHVEPSYRDGWNACYREALARFGTRPAAEPGAPGNTDAERAAWLADKIMGNDYIAEAAQLLRRWPAAEPSQSSSAGETWRRRAEHLDRELKAARVDVDSEIIEGQLKDFLLRFGGKYDGNGMWGVSLYLEDICQIMSALSRQAPAAPAAKDFEQWWTSEVVANGGAPIGADYKHWAKAGFELRGDARAPAAPAEADFEREVEDWEASQPFYDLAWRHGASQHLSFDGDELESLTFSVKDFENFCVALTPAAPTQALLGWTRYEKARKLNPAQWAELHQRNLAGETFDDMIDALPATTQPVQQDTLPGMMASVVVRQGLIDWVAEQWHAQVAKRPMVNVHRRSLDDTWRQILRYLGVDDRARLGPTHDELRAEIGSKEWEAMNATQPAEKQAAPSGEDNHG